MELISIKKSILEYSEEVELKEMQISLKQNFAWELSMDYESSKLQFDLIGRMSFGYLKDLKEKEKHFYSFKTGLEDCLQDLEAKERPFGKSVKEFELGERKFDSIRKAVEDHGKNLELKEKKLSNILQLQLKFEETENSTGDG
ncbi:hypothetical protein KPL71_015478 [Citrus sinensis]|uniref:Uncharacterized protein n=1 Tax=Citrus sinensis TaxID=2711 RepID=A0ACB8KJI5_CITSI|nr:hypothetical protein KPL71_015478 [Citrus sinensis]